ncbi:MAG TPA: hypothetical protein VFA41_04125 [Ktedonobacteraceae bacterium]|jgi:hypothetical protein|nr:hypothetical protein [Ktedonobacteraceae bacterium]
MLTQKHLQKIELLSDTVLYPESVAFVRRMIQKEKCNPLPATQVNGLLNIALTLKYNDVRRFVEHQRERNWPSSKRDIKTFYTHLEKELDRLELRLSTDFALTKDEQGRRVSSEDEQEMLGLLIRDYVQHLLAENMLVEAELKEQQRFQQGSHRR